MGMRVVALICLLLAGIRPALAADTVEYGPAPAWLEPVEPPAVDTGKRADAPLRVLKRSAQLRFDRGGVETYVENYIRVQTPQGLQGLGSITLPWKPDTDVLTVHHCELLRGGKVIDLIAAGQRLEVVRRENNLEYAALDGILTAVLQPNGMEVGDVLRLAFSVKRSSSLLPATEALLSDIAAGPVERYELHAQWDRDTPMRWQASEDVKGARETRAGKQFHFRWTADDIEPLAQPTNVPARFWRFPHVEFTSYSSWNEVSRVLAPLYAQPKRAPLPTRRRMSRRASKPR